MSAFRSEIESEVGRQLVVKGLMTEEENGNDPYSNESFQIILEDFDFEYFDELVELIVEECDKNHTYPVIPEILKRIKADVTEQISLHFPESNEEAK